MDKDILLKALTRNPEFIAGVEKTKREIKAIGETLYFLTKAESVMDLCLAVWMTGDTGDPQFGRIEGFISKVPFRTKIDWAKEIGLLDKESASSFHKLYDLRNAFAHNDKKGDCERNSKTVMAGIEPIHENMKKNIDNLLVERLREKILRMRKIPNQTPD